MKLVSGKQKLIPLENLSDSRYEFISLQEVEPNLGIADQDDYVLVYRESAPGRRAWVNVTDIAGEGPQGPQGVPGPQGSQGDNGTSVRIIGSVPDVNVNPPNNPQTTLNTAFPGRITGDGVIDLATKDLWFYDGSVWSNVGNIQGPEGPQGPQGTPGLDGSDGDDGADGAIGPQGPIGPQGIQGAQGIPGAQGTSGTSIEGPPGPQGPQGHQGNAGAQGSVGTSITGPQGPQGVPGPQGPQGSGGAKGDTGESITGPQGRQGVQGAVGPQGPQGHQGASGLNGQDGDTGLTGPQGRQGHQGHQGAAGAVGAQGVSGATLSGGSADKVAIWASSSALTFDNNIYRSGSNLYASDFIIPSDKQLKSNINTLDNVLSKLQTINGVTYNWSDKAKEIGYTDESLQLGIIAQEIAKIYPEAIEYSKEGYMCVKYERLVAILIQAIKELNDKFENHIASHEKK